jgi:hypothetical protein
MMTSEEYQWHVKLIQGRYHDLNLTYEQAEQIYKYEEDKNTYSEKHFFSAWEELDYELATFKQILNPDQLYIYESSFNEHIQRYEKELIEQDNEKSIEIAYHEELIKFYETQFLPDFFKDPFILLFGSLHTDKAKIDYLKSEYKSFLNDSKKSILTSHFRNYRTFKPNELKASLLRHKLSYILPDYSSFKHQMDEPTTAVAAYLTSMLKHYPDRIEELLTRKFEELKVFNKSSFKKYHGEPKGWHVVIGQLTPEEEKQHRIMTLLLLDKEKYGF